MTVHHIAACVEDHPQESCEVETLRSNPMAGVELDTVPHREARVLDGEAMAWYLEAARAYGLFELLKFAAWHWLQAR